jgi:hypothetical protein
LNQSGSRALLLVQAPAAGKGTPLPHRPHRGIPTESAHVTTTIDTDHPLFNTNGERMRINAVLRHLGSGADLRDFPASPSEKVALVKTASQRGLITWHKGRGRYELTATGWCELAPTRRFGVGSMMLGTTVGATVGAVALAVFWFTAGAAHAPVVPRSAAAPAPVQVAKLSAPAVSGAASNAVPVASEATPAPSTTAAAAPPPAAPATAAPARDAAPAAAPVEPERTRVADEPTPEQLAEAAKAKQTAAKKARQRAAARQRRREEAARAWAAEEPRSRQAEYSGHGVYGGYGYGGYGGGNSWFAYR